MRDLPYDRDALCAYLEDHGVDVTRVLQRDIGPSGYYYIHTGWKPERPELKERMLWPRGFVWEDFLVKEEGAGKWTTEDHKRNREITRDYFTTLLKSELGSMTPRQRKQFRRRYPIIAISVNRLTMD